MANRSDFSATSPVAALFLALALFSSQAFAGPLTKFVDQKNGFSVYYPASWVKVESNEPETKIILVAPEGFRCLVVVAQNPASTAKNAAAVVDYLIKSKGKDFEDYLKKKFVDAKVFSVERRTLSGNFPSALFSYVYVYETLDVKAPIGVIEAQTPTEGFTYKTTCSHLLDSLTSPSFVDGSTTFFRSFQIIPRRKN